MSKPFSCPVCGCAIPFKQAFFLNNNSSVVCCNCNSCLSPKPMSKAYFGIGFIGTVAASQIFLLFKKDIIQALLVGLLTGAILYIGGVFYAYKNVEFELS